MSKEEKLATITLALLFILFFLLLFQFHIEIRNGVFDAGLLTDAVILGIVLILLIR